MGLSISQNPKRKKKEEQGVTERYETDESQTPQIEARRSIVDAGWAHDVLTRYCMTAQPALTAAAKHGVDEL